MLRQIILWRLFTCLIWLKLFTTCSVTCTCHWIHRIPIWNYKLINCTLQGKTFFWFINFQDVYNNHQQEDHQGGARGGVDAGDDSDQESYHHQVQLQTYHHCRDPTVGLELLTLFLSTLSVIGVFSPFPAYHGYFVPSHFYITMLLILLLAGCFPQITCRQH